MYSGRRGGLTPDFAVFPRVTFDCLRSCCLSKVGNYLWSLALRFVNLKKTEISTSTYRLETFNFFPSIIDDSSLLQSSNKSLSICLT